PSAEAMRLFVKILEEEDPGWYSRIPEFINPQPVVDIEMHKPKEEPDIVPALTNGTGTSSIPEPKTISENGSSVETQDKVVILEGLSTVSAHEEWTALSVSGQRPKPRYEHGATVLQDKMYIFGGNHNGRYLSDLQVLDLKSLTWSKVDAKLQAGTSDSAKTAQVSPCAGHSLISCGNKFFSVAGHTKDPSDSITVKEFDPHTCTWSIVKTYGKPPVSRGGQSVTLVGTTLVVFGGEDAKRCLLNDLHILDLETMTWDDVDAIGTPPAPRSDHVAACHADRYLLIFGGGSHATCFNDLHVLDLQTMEWSRPKQQGPIPSPRAGHAGATVGENWYIVGGGNNKSGVSETLVLNMSTLAWSVVSTVEGRVPLASEGMTLLYSNYSGEDYLISFGGYNGRYSNEVYALKLSVKLDLQSSTKDQPTSDSTSRVLEPEVEISQDGKIREIAMDNADSV
uniref:ACB domain-containing protein n=1 Tax=Aegilops tauschii subsp. strangulata TaxID=200361 RepID=A0A453ME13_AEGTS